MASLILFCDICISVETGYTGYAMEIRSVEEARLCSEARPKRALAREFFGVEFSTSTSELN